MKTNLLLLVFALFLLPTTRISAQSTLESAAGKVALLRVHDVGGGYGPDNDHIDVEVILKLDSHPDMAYGFQLRDDKNRPAREGMLALLRDAMANNWTVSINYSINAGKKNGIITRVWVTK